MTVTEFLAVAIRLFLATIFIVAGLAKLANPRDAIQTLRDFGAPRRVQPFGVFLPVLEIFVAIGLLFARTAWYASWGALALLGLFIAGIGVNLARGRQPACNCFGQLHSRPISGLTLLRNAVLAGCATLLIMSGPPLAAADLWVFLVSLDSRGRRVAIVVAAVIGFAILHALKQPDPDPEPAVEDEPESPAPVPAATTAGIAPPQPVPAPRRTPARVLTDIGLPVGTPAPEFVLPDLAGQTHSLDSLRSSGKSVLLIFSSPFCESCQALLPKLPGLAALHDDAVRLVVISRGSVAHNLAKMTGPITLPVLLQQDFEVAEDYDCTSTPTAVLIGADGFIQSLLAVGAPAIQQLISSSTRQAPSSETPGTGAVATEDAAESRLPASE